MADQQAERAQAASRTHRSLRAIEAAAHRGDNDWQEQEVEQLEAVDAFGTGDQPQRCSVSTPEMIASESGGRKARRLSSRQCCASRSSKGVVTAIPMMSPIRNASDEV